MTLNTLALGLCHKKGDRYRLAGAVDNVFHQKDGTETYLIGLHNAQKLLLTGVSSLQKGDILQIDSKEIPSPLAVHRNFSLALSQAEISYVTEEDLTENGVLTDFLEATEVSHDQVKVFRGKQELSTNRQHWLASFSQALSAAPVYAQSFTEQIFPFTEPYAEQLSDQSGFEDVDDFVQIEQKQALKNVAVTGYIRDSWLASMSHVLNGGQAFFQDHGTDGQIRHGQLIQFDRRYEGVFGLGWLEHFATLQEGQYLPRKELLQRPDYTEKLLDFIAIHELAHCLDDQLMHHGNVPVFESFADSFALLAVANKYQDLEFCRVVAAGRWITPLAKGLTHATGPICDTTLQRIEQLQQEGLLGTLTPEDILHEAGEQIASLDKKSYLNILKQISEIYIDFELNNLDSDGLSIADWSTFIEEDALSDEVEDFISRSLKAFNNYIVEIDQLTVAEQQEYAGLIFANVQSALEELTDKHPNDYVGMEAKIRMSLGVNFAEEIGAPDRISPVAKNVLESYQDYISAQKVGAPNFLFEPEKVRPVLLGHWQPERPNFYQTLSADQRKMALLESVEKEEKWLEQVLSSETSTSRSFSYKERLALADLALERQQIAQACLYDPNFFADLSLSEASIEPMARFLNYLSFDDIGQLKFSAYHCPSSKLRQHSLYLVEQKELLEPVSHAKRPAPQRSKKRHLGY